MEILDMELALFLCYHMDHPCETADGHNIRPFYIDRIKALLKNHNFENPYAKRLLEEKLKQYDKTI